MVSQRREVVGGVLLLSSAMTVKSTAGKVIPLNGVYRNFGIRVLDIGTTGTSSYSIKAMLALSSVFSTAAMDFVQATSANRGKIKISTGSIPASWIKFQSSKFTTKSGRKLRVELSFLP